MSLTKRIFGAACLMLAMLAGPTGVAQMTQFANSTSIGADPGVIWLPLANGGAGAYLGSYTGSPLVLFQSAHLEDLFGSTTQYTFPTTGTGAILEGSGHWAPEFVLWKGLLYMSYTDADSQKTHVIVANDATNPITGGWAQVTGDPALPSNTTGHDWSYFTRADGTLWSFYASQNGGAYSGVVVQAMKNPYTPLSGSSPVQISYAIEKGQGSGTGYTNNYRWWEHIQNKPNGQGVPSTGCNEAPYGFAHANASGGQDIFVVYSADWALSGDYLLGMLTFTGTASQGLDAVVSGQPLWSKSTNPVFQSLNDASVNGVGSNTMVPSPDGTQLWNVYGGTFRGVITDNATGDVVQERSECSEPQVSQMCTTANNNTRTLRAQMITWDGANGQGQGGTPDFGSPARDGVLLTQPTDEPTGAPYDFFTPNPGHTLVYASTVGNIAGDTGTNRIMYSGQWTLDGTGTLMEASANTAYFLVDFVGTQIEIDGPTGSGYGDVDIYIDGDVGPLGTPTATANLANPLTPNVIYKSGTLATGAHTALVMIDTSLGKGTVALLQVQITNQ